MRDMVSGAGHDAAYIARVAPTTMIFVPCAGACSHNEAESTTLEECAAGSQVLLEAVLADDAALRLYRRSLRSRYCACARRHTPDRSRQQLIEFGKGVGILPAAFVMTNCEPSSPRFGLGDDDKRTDRRSFMVSLLRSAIIL